MSHRRSLPQEVIGLIPAAGLATRMGRAPGSKEIYPIGFTSDSSGRPRPRAACEYLLEALREGGVRRAYVVLREGKWDIPAYLRDGRDAGLALGYLIMRHPYGAPFTLDQAYPFVRESVVAFGFPDVVFEPASAFAHALAHLRQSRADAVLGLFPAVDPRSCDMVGLGDGGRLRRLEIKPTRTSLTLTWGLAVWTPTFTEFLHECVQSLLGDGERSLSSQELFVGDVLERAAETGLVIEGVEVSDRPFFDIGTPEGLREVVRRLSNSPPGESAAETGV